MTVKKIKRKKSFPAIYRVIPIAKDPDDPDGPLVKTDEYLIQGSLFDHIIVSVPISISHRAAHELSERLVAELGQPVLLVTHNINFLTLERLSKAEAEKVVDRIMSNVVEDKLELEQVKKIVEDRDPTRDADQPDEKAGSGGEEGSGLHLVGGNGDHRPSGGITDEEG